MGLSVVIITRNEAHIIGNTLQSLQGVTDDVIIVDSGSTDDTIAICKKFNAHVIETKWEGYGITKNKGIDAATNNWILSLDADEAIDEELKEVLARLDLSNENSLYELKFRNFFCNKWIRFGEWAGDKHIRLFNRNKVRWDDAPVHENLLITGDPTIIKLKGNVLHYTVNSIDEYMAKSIHYAKLNAHKYFLQGKKSGYLNLYAGPMFNFLKHYVFELGFLDGFEGYLIAKTTAWYSFMKYTFLRELTGLMAKQSDGSNKKLISNLQQSFCS